MRPPDWTTEVENVWANVVLLNVPARTVNEPSNVVAVLLIVVLMLGLLNLNAGMWPPLKLMEDGPLTLISAVPPSKLAPAPVSREVPWRSIVPPAGITVWLIFPS